MRKLSNKWIHKTSGEEYQLVHTQRAAYGSHEMVTLARSEIADTVVVRSTINLYDDFQPIQEENHETSQ
jgi:hypothetical protein